MDRLVPGLGHTRSLVAECSRFEVEGTGADNFGADSFVAGDSIVVEGNIVVGVEAASWAVAGAEGWVVAQVARPLLDADTKLGSLEGFGWVWGFAVDRLRRNRGRNSAPN